MARFEVINKTTGAASVQVDSLRQAYFVMSLLEGEDVRADKFEPDSYFIKEVPER